MLLGCDCHCGNFPDVSLFPSNNSASIITPPFLCGACYNFPTRWKVTFNHDWFTGQANPGAYIEECPLAPSYFDYTLKQIGAIAPNCASWASDERATNLSSLPCPPDEPIYAICGPHNPTPRVSLGADDFVDTTLFTLSFKWIVPNDGNTCDLLPVGFIWQGRAFRKNQTPTSNGTPISCVRGFELTFQGRIGEGDPLYPSPPITLSLDNAWQTIFIEPV
jgi:hypothetical protein